MLNYAEEVMRCDECAQRPGERATWIGMDLNIELLQVRKEQSFTYISKVSH